jgi:hypothetical protein
MTVLAGDAAAGTAASAAGALAPIAGANQGERQPAGSSVAFAIAVLLLGFACIGLWIAFHKPENAETGGFPGLLGQMTQWIHAGEDAGGAAAAASETPSQSELDKIKALPSSFWTALTKVAGGSALDQFRTWILHLP